MEGNEQSSFSERGFTLVELLVVTLLLAMLSSILWGSLNGLMRSREIVENRRVGLRTGYTFLKRLSGELMSASPIALVDGSAGTTGGGPAKQSQRVFFGKNARLSQGDADSITFVSATGAQDVIGGGGNRGAVQIRYYVTETPASEESLVIGSSKKRLILIREEMPAGITDQRKIQSKTLRFPITSDLASLNFRYYSKKQWVEEWKQIGNQLPEAVEIDLSVYQKSGELSHFKTAVFLNAGNSSAGSGTQVP